MDHFPGREELFDADHQKIFIDVLVFHYVLTMFLLRFIIWIYYDFLGTMTRSKPIPAGGQVRNACFP